MRVRAILVAATAVTALGLAVPALADDGMEMGGAAEPARVLALQALAVLTQGDRYGHGHTHEQAMQKLDQALTAEDKSGLDLSALRAADKALHNDSPEEATRLLRNAFPAGSSHVVGVTYRPRIATARVVAGLLGAVLLAAAAAGLIRRRRLDQRRGAA